MTEILIHNSAISLNDAKLRKNKYFENNGTKKLE